MQTSSRSAGEHSCYRQQCRKHRRDKAARTRAAARAAAAALGALLARGAGLQGAQYRRSIPHTARLSGWHAAACSSPPRALQPAGPQACLDEADARAAAAAQRALAAESSLGDAEREVRRLGARAAAAQADAAAAAAAAAARGDALAQVCARLEQRGAADPGRGPNQSPEDTGHDALRPGAGTLAVVATAGSAAGGSGPPPALTLDGDWATLFDSPGPDASRAGSPGPLGAAALPARAPGHGMGSSQADGGAPADAIDRLVCAWRGACAEREGRIAELEARLAQVRPAPPARSRLELWRAVAAVDCLPAISCVLKI